MRLFVLFALAATSMAQTGIAVHGSVRSRVEMWDWFDAGLGDGSYALSGTSARLSIGQSTKSREWMVEVMAPILLGLPERAALAAPQLQLGMGGNYYQANRNARNAGMVFLKQGFIRWKGLFGDELGSLRAGRFEFSDGAETTPPSATLAAIKRDRIAQRLIGPFGFTHVGRSFDGLHYVRNGQTLNLTVVAATPTRGVFQTDGWGWVQTGFVYAALNGRVAQHTDWRLLGLYYQDWRDVLKTDNRPLALRQGDFGNLRIGTFGGHWLRTIGAVDLLAWGVVQTGTWGRQDHRAGAVALEGGYQPPVWKKVRPWIRAGYFYGSGDNTPTDGRHSTFFEVLPTPRPFARVPFFNLMNNEDRHASVTLRPGKQLTLKSEFHALRLAARNDQWILGGGVFQPWTFGYVGRPSNGRRGLANLYDVSADYVVNPNLMFAAYLGYINGRSVISAIYPKNRDGAFGYLEVTARF